MNALLFLQESTIPNWMLIVLFVCLWVFIKLILVLRARSISQADMMNNTTMQIPRLSYEEVHSYVRNYINGSGEGQYDAIGAIHFMLAALDNLFEGSKSEEWMEEYFGFIGNCATQEQREILIKLGRFLESFIPDDED